MLGVFDIGGTGYRVAPGWDNNKLGEVIHGLTCSNYREGVSSLIKSLNISGAKNRFEKIAGCIAGTVDQNNGKLISSPNLTDWVGKPLKSDLENEFGCPVLLENDAAGEGLGEAVFGAGKGFKTIGFFTVGTGIGGAKIEDGKIVERAEPGWQIVFNDGEVGYLEAMAGGRAIERIYGKKPIEITDPKIWEHETRLLAMGIHNAITFWNPEVMVLGGSIFKSIDLEMLKQILTEQNARFPKLPEIVRGSLGQEAGLWGCLKLAGN